MSIEYHRSSSNLPDKCHNCGEENPWESYPEGTLESCGACGVYPPSDDVDSLRHTIEHVKERLGSVLGELKSQVQGVTFREKITLLKKENEYLHAEFNKLKSALSSTHLLDVYKPGEEEIYATLAVPLSVDQIKFLVEIYKPLKYYRI